MSGPPGSGPPCGFPGEMGHPANLQGGSKSNMSDYINAALRQIEQSIGDRDPNLPPGMLSGGPLPPGPPGHNGLPPPPHGMVPPGMVPHWEQPPPPGFFPTGPPGMMPEMVQFDETSPHHPAFVGFDGLRSGPPPGLMADPGGMQFFPPGSEPSILPPMSTNQGPTFSAPQPHLPPVSGNESRPFDQGHPHPGSALTQTINHNGTHFNHSPDGSRCSISPRDSGYDSCEVVKHEC